MQTSIQEAYIAILEDIAKKCCHKLYFYTNQANRISTMDYGHISVCSLLSMAKTSRARFILQRAKPLHLLSM